MKRFCVANQWILTCKIFLGLPLVVENCLCLHKMVAFGYLNRSSYTVIKVFSCSCGYFLHCYCFFGSYSCGYFLHCYCFFGWFCKNMCVWVGVIQFTDQRFSGYIEFSDENLIELSHVSLDWLIDY